ncbi:MAG: putative ABC transporter permease [Spirochaetia bacterium]|jgi:uncharacterized membrane protein|nr:putative ABC transporter permease [Spirochaetia bacterium]
MSIELFEQLAINFFIYSVIGWCCEVVYCSVPAGHFINRGFLHGPYLPIYGFGALIIIYVIVPVAGRAVGQLRGNILSVFLAGAVSSSFLEYFGSWFLEKLFHIKLWDYSKHRFNLNGRICLLNSVLFGLLGVVITRFFSIGCTNTILRLPQDVLYSLSMTIVVGMGVDFTASCFKMKAFQRRVENLHLKTQELKERAIALQKESLSSELMSKLTAKMEAEIDNMKGEIGRTGRRIILSNPSMTSRNEGLRLQLETARNELRSWRARGMQAAKERRDKMMLLLEDSKKKSRK